MTPMMWVLVAVPVAAFVGSTAAVLRHWLMDRERVKPPKRHGSAKVLFPEI